MRVAVLTSTKRPGGLDVTYGALKRQTYQDIIWIVADELQQARQDVFKESVKEIDAIHFQPKHTDGYYSNLPAIYNTMMEIAESYGCDLAVSLQDYIWISPTGIEEFVYTSAQCPNALLTGLCSMLAEPPASAVDDSGGNWTIFDDPYEGPRPDAFIAWQDVRASLHAPGLTGCSAQHWEMNWAAIPLPTHPRFDPKYGEHIGNENQQFAADWIRSGGTIVMDADNHAYSLPHRHYFPEEWADQQEHREINQRLYQEEYGD